MNDYHIVPIDDLRPHNLVRDCWCKPTLEPSEEGAKELVIHNSLDGREAYEAGRKLS